MKKFNIGWGLTNACNMNCQFCYSKGTRISTTDTKIEDWKNFVDKNHQYIDSINYGTGENSIIDSFFEFIWYVRKNYPEIKQALTTNGYTYDRVSKNKEFYDIFIKSIDEVDVSLDFYKKERHNEFRGQPNAYEWALNMLQLLKDTNKLSTIVFVGFDETLNEDNLDGLFKIAKKYDAILRMNIYRPVSKDKSINDRFICSYEKLKKALEYLNKKHEIINLSDALLGNIFTNSTNIKDMSGTNSIRILPNGDICPSTYLIDENYRNKYNIKNNIDLSRVVFEDFESPAIPKACEGCKYAKSCKGGVFDRRILWYGTFEERDPYCPLRHNEQFPEEKFAVTKTGRISVHDDYLPTLFFKSKG